MSRQLADGVGTWIHSSEFALCKFAVGCDHCMVSCGSWSNGQNLFIRHRKKEAQQLRLKCFRWAGRASTPIQIGVPTVIPAPVTVPVPLRVDAYSVFGLPLPLPLPLTLAASMALSTIAMSVAVMRPSRFKSARSSRLRTKTPRTRRDHHCR